MTFCKTVLYVPEYLALSFFCDSTFCNFPLEKASLAAPSQNLTIEDPGQTCTETHGDTMMKRLSHMLTNFASRFALLCGLGLASLFPLYAQQSTEQAIHPVAANTSPDRVVDQTADQTDNQTAGRTVDQTADSDVPEAPTPQSSSNSQSNSQSSSNSVVIATPLTFSERLRIYEHSFITPEGLIGPALGAAVGQANNTSPEWGQGAAGYGTRLGSAYGRSVIARTVALGVATVDREDSRFQPSNETGFWRRTKHAVVGTLVSRTPSGGNMPAISRFVGVYSAAFIANAWEPPSQDSSAKAWERGSTALASSIGWHVFEEFCPDIPHALHLRHEQ